MAITWQKTLVVGTGAAAAGFLARSIAPHVLGTPEQREDVGTKLSWIGAAAGVVGLAGAALGPSALRSPAIGLGIAGAAAFIGSQLLLPHVDSPSAE